VIPGRKRVFVHFEVQRRIWLRRFFVILRNERFISSCLIDRTPYVGLLPQMHTELWLSLRTGRSVDPHVSPAPPARLLVLVKD